MLAKNASAYLWMEPGVLNCKKYSSWFILSANIYWRSTLFQGYSGTRQTHILLISSGDSCILTTLKAEERQEKKYLNFVVIASVVIENILAL